MALPQNDMQHILDLMAEDWFELRGQRVFITGGTGFVGTWLLESFVFADQQINLNASVVVLTRNRDAFARNLPHLVSHPKIDVIEGDIESFEFPAGSFSHVIHAATETSHFLIDSNPTLAFEKIVRGLQHVCDFAKHASVKKMLFTSSGSVYGVQPPEQSHLHESYLGGPDLFSPHAAYAEGKRVSEMLGCAAARKHGFEFKIARCFSFVGPNMPLDQHFAIGNFLRDALNGGPVIVEGDGTPYRSYLHTVDMTVWLWTILFRGENCLPYNVGSDVAVTIRECAETLAALTPKPCEVVVRGVADSSLPASRYVPDINRAHSELGLSVTVPFQEALKRTLSILQNNDKGILS